MDIIELNDILFIWIESINIFFKFFGFDWQRLIIVSSFGQNWTFVVNGCKFA